jgi:hypothetical protein
MNFKSNIPEYHDVSYIQNDSPGASSSTSSPTITAINMPHSMWSLYRPSFQPSSTAYPIYTHLPPSPGYMGYQLSSPTSTGFYSPTSQSSDYHHHAPATLSHISNATFTTSVISNKSVNNNPLAASYVNSSSMYTYQPNHYYNINSRESLHIIEPPPIPIPTQTRSMPLPVQQQHQQQQVYQQQMQFQMQMQSQPYSPQFVVGSPQTQRVKRGLSSSLKKSKRKHETQRENTIEEQDVPEKRLRRTRSASASAATTTTAATINTPSNVMATKKSTAKNNKKTKKATKKKKKPTTKSPDATPVPSPLLSEKELQDDDANALNKLEDELSFLNDECATILMMLDSLRNAYLAAGPQQASSLTTSPSSHDLHIIEEQQRRSTDFVQNRDIEKEMRIAYDDLMLQVRQVEKKINKVERKSQMITTQRSTQPNAKSPTNSVEAQDQPENKEEANKSP